MKHKITDSSPLKVIAEIFNIKQNIIKNGVNKSDISLLTEISEQKVILEFNWIEDLNIIISSFVVDDFDEHLLHHQLSIINNELIIGNLKQSQTKSITYRHSLPLPGKIDSTYIKKYLEDLLSEFNHLITVLIKEKNSLKYSNLKNHNKIVGHA